MYGRDYDGKSLNFEPSGGLTNASLVMQDKETNTFWSLMKGAALEGKFKGRKLTELPLGEKSSWKDWKAKHPNTKVLSVNGVEDAENSYRQYFQGQNGFRGLQAKDSRLKTMSPIFAFRFLNRTDLNTPEKVFAIQYSEINSGLAIKLAEDHHLFLFRQKDDKVFRSTTALISARGFEKVKGTWTELKSGKPFDISTRSFDVDLERQKGFDTFWYNWSLNNPETEILNQKNKFMGGSQSNNDSAEDQ